MAHNYFKKLLSRKSFRPQITTLPFKKKRCVSFEPPQLVAQPAMKELCAVSGTIVTLSVTATGTQPMRFSWYKDGIMLFDSFEGTQSTLVITGVVKENEGTYQCVVSNLIETTPSNAVLVRVADPPQVTVHPKELPQSVSGSPVSLSVSATGTGPLSYSWLRNGEALVEGGRIQGVSESTLTISSVAEEDEGSYQCVVSNMAGAATSSSAGLSVVLPDMATVTMKKTDQLPQGNLNEADLMHTKDSSVCMDAERLVCGFPCSANNDFLQTLADIHKPVHITCTIQLFIF